MQNFAITLSYDGTNYHGWQRQPNNITVQQMVEEALFSLTKDNISINGCSRTDAGVHALEYVFNFKSGIKIPANKICDALNHYLNVNDIIAVNAKIVDDDFHARFSSKGKRYVYKIWNQKSPSPFTCKYRWHVPYQLSLSEMQKAAKCFEGKHDFSGFMSSGSGHITTVRTIRDCEINKSPEFSGQIEIEIEADAFLYNMVRIITGTLVDVGRGRINSEIVPDIINSCNRKKAGQTAPPQGLFLKKVYY